MNFLKYSFPRPTANRCSTTKNVNAFEFELNIFSIAIVSIILPTYITIYNIQLSSVDLFKKSTSK